MYIICTHTYSFMLRLIFLIDIFLIAIFDSLKLISINV